MAKPVTGARCRRVNSNIITILFAPNEYFQAFDADKRGSLQGAGI